MELYESSFELYTKRMKLITSDRTKISELVDQYTADLGSEWYSDDVWIIALNNGNRIFFEAESDGTEFGVFAVGPSADSEYKKISNLLIKL